MNTNVRIAFVRLKKNVFSRPSNTHTHVYINIVQKETRGVSIMLSGQGYCTQPSCFPVLGAPPIPVFLCKTHCGHMLCYKHWLSHQTTQPIELDDQQDINQSIESGY